MQGKLKRYKQLSAMDTDDQTDEQIQEQVDLYYEIYVQVDADGLDQLGQRLWDEVEALERLDMFLDGDREVEDE